MFENEYDGRSIRFYGKRPADINESLLVKREDERAQENQELKDMVKELRDTHKQDVKTQTNLMKSIDNLTNQVADLTTQNKSLQQKANDLLSQISVE